MTPLAPRIVKSISYLTRINDECDFSWQAQYFVMLDNDFGRSAHCKSRFRCDKDQSQVSLFVAGTVFGSNCSGSSTV